MDGGGDRHRGRPWRSRRRFSDPANVDAAGTAGHPAGAGPAPPPPPALGLSTIDREGQLQINWDRTSPAVQHADDAVLEINEGGPLPSAIQLDAAHLQTGSFTYARTAEKVDVKLIVHRRMARISAKSPVFWGNYPNAKRQRIRTP